MTQEQQEKIAKEHLSRRDHRFLIAWAMAIAVLYALAGYYCVRQLQYYKMETREYRQTWMQVFSEEQRKTSRHDAVKAGAQPIAVHVGVSFNRISDVALRESSVTVGFDIWFQWKGDSLDPGKNFHILNGTILEREKIKDDLVDGTHFEQYRVSARIGKNFDTARFPFSDQGLFIIVADKSAGAETMRFVAEDRTVDTTHLVVPLSLRITRTLAAVSSQRYSLGLHGGDREQSVYIAVLLVQPPSSRLFMKLFQALYASVAITLIVFFIKPIHVDPRFGLAVGAFFAAVGNNIYIAAILPQSDRITLADMVNGIGLFTIFLALAQSAASLYILDSLGKERFSRMFDMVSFAVLFTGYVALNLILPLAARS